MKNILISVIVLLFISSCKNKNSRDIDHAIHRLQQEKYYIPKTGWSVRELNNYKDTMYYYDLTYDQGDTLYSLAFEISNIKSKDVNYRIDWFEKSYTKDGYLYCQIYKRDTVVYYRASLEDRLQKEFYLGKYYYMLHRPSEFLEKGYTINHLTYIRNNLDSLRFIRGDSLTFPHYLNEETEEGDK